MMENAKPGKRCYAKVPFGTGTIRIPVVIMAVHEDGTCDVREKFSRHHWKDHGRVPVERLFAGDGGRGKTTSGKPARGKTAKGRRGK